MRIVVKVGTSTLAHATGRLNIRHAEELVKVLSDLKNAGHEVILVSSGAIGMGVGKLGLKARPTQTQMKQAVAAVGQCELMFMYDKLFGEYGSTVAQILLTGDVISNPISRGNVENTFEALLDMGIIPVVNENDTVAVDELEGQRIGDNDNLSSIVAQIVKADLLVILTDIDALYDADPRTHPQAKRIPYVEKVTPEIFALAGDAGSERGTGGMVTKLQAAQRAGEAGIACCIMCGDNPSSLYTLLDGKSIGTLFG